VSSAETKHPSSVFQAQKGFLPLFMFQDPDITWVALRHTAYPTDSDSNGPKEPKEAWISKGILAGVGASVFDTCLTNGIQNTRFGVQTVRSENPHLSPFQCMKSLFQKAKPSQVLCTGLAPLVLGRPAYFVGMQSVEKTSTDWLKTNGFSTFSTTVLSTASTTAVAVPLTFILESISINGMQSVLTQKPAESLTFGQLKRSATPTTLRELGFSYGFTKLDKQIKASLWFQKATKGLSDTNKDRFATGLAAQITAWGTQPFDVAKTMATLNPQQPLYQSLTKAVKEGGSGVLLSGGGARSFRIFVTLSTLGEVTRGLENSTTFNQAYNFFFGQ